MFCSPRGGRGRGGVPFRLSSYTAISINVVGVNLQTYESRPNGAMGIYCNLHITIQEIYKFVFLHVEYLFFFPWNLSCIFSFAVMWFGLFFLNEMRRKRIFSSHVWRERKRKTSRLLYRCISLVFSTRGTLFLRPYCLSVLSLSFELQSDNVNWNSCILVIMLKWHKKTLPVRDYFRCE